MNNKLDNNFINNLIKYGSIFLLSLIGLIVFYYIGFLNIIKEIIVCILPVLFAVFLSFIMEPIVRFFIKRKIKRQYSVLISYFSLITLIAIILLITLPSFINQLEVLINDLPNIIQEVESAITNLLKKLGVEIEFDRIFADSFTKLIPSVAKIATSAFSIITKIGIVFIGSLYLSFDFPKFRNKIKSLIPDKYKEEVIPFLKKYEYFCYRYVYGILFDAIILWVLAGGGFYIIGLEYAIVFGFIVALFDLIPYIGPIIGGAPAVIVALTVNAKFTILVLCVVLVAQFIESNIIQPLILKSVISLHPLEGILGILVLGTLFGFIGMVISPIVVTLIKLIIPCIKSIKEKKKILKKESK